MKTKPFDIIVPTPQPQYLRITEDVTPFEAAKLAQLLACAHSPYIDGLEAVKHFGLERFFVEDGQ